MTPERHARVSELFLAALDHAGPARQAFLDGACGGDAELRSEVETLLARDARSAVVDNPVLQTPLSGLFGESGASPAAPQRVGRYEILGVLGEGGMGTVYRARQSQPERAVALKVVRGPFSPALLRRFEFESAVLARLQHPGIAQIYDAGVADVGGRATPFFAMELIDGVPLTEFAAAQRLDARGRLRLLARVCEAVAHAHQRGVIHRDLKPANILVVDEGLRGQGAEGWRGGGAEGLRGIRLDGTSGSGADGLRDGGIRAAATGASPGSAGIPPPPPSAPRPLGPLAALSAQPKVLDFGVARAIDADAAAVTRQTQAGQVVGTLPYMSPEQLSGDPGAVDLRCDVYALGVIGYELLAGRLPYAVQGRSIAQAARVIDEGAAAPLGRVDRRLRGDVETIVARAMDRDLARRYPSAGELGREIERYLAGEPIDARRDSRLYVLRRTLARHRVAVAVAGAFVLLLVAATAAATTLALAEARQRRLADKRAEETQQVAAFQSRMLSKTDIDAMGRGLVRHLREQAAAGLARPSLGSAADAAGRSPAQIEAALAAFDDVCAAAAPPDVARRVLAEFVLARAAEALESQFADQPLVRARLHLALGGNYRDLALYEPAETHLKTALDLYEREHGRAHIDVAEALNQYALLLHMRRDLAAAEPLYRESLALLGDQLGPQRLRVAEQMANLAALLGMRGDYAAAEPLFHEALDRLRAGLGDEHELVARGLSNFAEVLSATGDFAGAEEAQREALAIRRAHPAGDGLDVAGSLNNLANLLTTLGREEEAASLQREELDGFRRALGVEHPHSVTALHNLANTLRSTGQTAAAEPLFREAIELSHRLRGRTDKELPHSLTGLGLALQARGALDEAEPLLREALALLEARLGPHDKAVGTALNNLAALLHARRDYAAAEPLYRRALEVRRAGLPADHPDLAGVLNNLAAMLRDAGEFGAAEPFYREAVAIYRRLPGQQPRLAVSLAGWGRVLHGAQEYAAAEPVFREALELQRRVLPRGDDMAPQTQARLGLTLVRLGRLDEAEPLLEEARAALERSPPSPGLRIATEALAELYKARDAVVVRP